MNSPGCFRAGSDRRRAMTSNRCFSCNDDGACESPLDRRFPLPVRESLGTTNPLVGTRVFSGDMPLPVVAEAVPCRQKTRGAHTKFPVPENPTKTQEHA